MNRNTVLGSLVFLVAHFTNSQLFAQSDAVAYVNDQAISLNVVHHFLDRTLSNLPEFANPEDRPASVVQAGIQHCVDREVILQHLQSGKHKTSEDEIDRQVEEWESQLKRVGKTLQQSLKESRLTISEFRRERLWKTSWRKYAEKYVTIDHLQKQFELKKKYYDGTKVHVAQILLKGKHAEMMDEAEEILEKLNSNKQPWSDAVKEHSQAASATKDGDLGWIDYSGPMPRDFTQHAFELAVGEYSKPFSSRYGVHLVRCIEIATGSKTFGDVAPQLRELETSRLFRLVSQRHKPKAKIRVLAAE